MCVNRRHFFIDEKNFPKFDLTGELISVQSYYIIIRSLKSQFLVLQFVKDSHREKAKSPESRKSKNMGVWAVSTINQLFIRGS